MCLTEFVTIVFVVALSLIDASTNLTSAEVCQQIRTNQLSILTMGSRGHRDPAKHRFYLLTSLGYLFVVPFANLKVDLQTKRAKLIIDTDYKDASQLYNEPSAIFTTKPGKKGAFQMFFLISNDQDKHFLVRFKSSTNAFYHFYYLDEGGIVDYVHKLEKDVRKQFAMNIESNDRCVKNSVFFYQIKSTPNGFTTEILSDYCIGKPCTGVVHYLDTLVFTLKSPVLTSFYVGVNGHNYTVLLSDSGRVIVGENAFEVSLSEFIECSFPSNNSPFPWIVVIIASVVVITLGGCALYLVVKKRKAKANRKAEAREASPSPSTNSSIPKKMKKKKQRKERKLTNLSLAQSSTITNTLDDINGTKAVPSPSMQARTLITSELDSPFHSSITPSKIYTSINMITSKIGSLFQSSAKSVAKANKSKDKTKGNKSKLDKAKVAKIDR